MAWDKFEFEPASMGLWIRLGSEANAPMCFVPVMDLELFIKKCNDSHYHGQVFNAMNIRKLGVNDL